MRLRRVNSIPGPNGTRSNSPGSARRAAIGKTMKSKKVAPLPLAKGQLWRMEDKHIEIMEVGKTLTHYRLFQSQKRVPISLGGITAVQAYLKTNGAKLIRKASPLKAA